MEANSDFAIRYSYGLKGKFYACLISLTKEHDKNKV